MTATEWIILDNLKNGWGYQTDLCDKEKTETSLRSCIAKKWVEQGRITNMGKMALMIEGRNLEK